MRVAIDLVDAGAEAIVGAVVVRDARGVLGAVRVVHAVGEPAVAAFELEAALARFGVALVALGALRADAEAIGLTFIPTGSEHEHENGESSHAALVGGLPPKVTENPSGNRDHSFLEDHLRARPFADEHKLDDRMSGLMRALVLVILACAIANAEPRRVLVVDDDVELLHAIETSVAPWKLVVTSTPATTAFSDVVATRTDVQFIVWREGAELVVFDRERGVTERRPAHEGPMDPVAAASAALTVKTMMRLPDPEPSTAPPPPPIAETRDAIDPDALVPAESGERVRVHAGIGADTSSALRAALGLMWRPALRLRVGLVAEFATAGIDESGYTGTARDYAGLAVASWDVPLGPFSVEPYLGAGAMRNVVSADHNGMPMDIEDSAVLPIVHAGVAGWWYVNDWGLGVTAGMQFTLGTHTYTKDPGNMVVFEVPPITAGIALVGAWRR